MFLQKMDNKTKNKNKIYLEAFETLGKSISFPTALNTIFVDFKENFFKKFEPTFYSLIYYTPGKNREKKRGE